MAGSPALQRAALLGFLGLTGAMRVVDPEDLFSRQLGPEPVGDSLVEAEKKPLTGGESGLLQKTNPDVVKSLHFATRTLRQGTARCAPTAQVRSVELLSAQSEVVDGLAVALSLKLTGKAQEGQADQEAPSSYHTVTVVWEAKDTGLVPHVLLPMAPEGSRLGRLPWCELLVKSSSTALSELAEQEGHQAVLEYHGRLGYLGGYGDAGVNQDSLLEVKSAQCPGLDALPANFSYRNHPTYGRCVNKNAVTNQGGCGSCWAFAVSHAASARACLQYPDVVAPAAGTRKHFSAQAILSCNAGKQGCNGGWMGTGFTEYQKGIPWAEDYVYRPRGTEFPWNSLGLPCQWGVYAKPFVSQAPYSVAKTVAAFQAELFCNGPFTIAFTVYQNFFGFFNSARRTAVYNTTANTTAAGGHAVVLVGWGTQNGVDYWEILNSWGNGWADEGFFKMQRGINLAGVESNGNSASRILKADATWVYNNWTSCVDGVKQRGVKCVSVADRTPVDESLCPTLPGSGWPARACQEISVGSSSTLTKTVTLPWNDMACNSTPVNPQVATTVNETFAALVNSTNLTVRRTDRAASWRQSLRLSCCRQTPFPRPMPNTSTLFAEMPPLAVSTECAENGTCPVTYCNGNGAATVGVDGKTCSCKCEPGYALPYCNSCEPGYEGYPTCREKCTRAADCNGQGAAFGVKWLNEFKSLLTTCSCACDSGWTGLTCDTPVTAATTESTTAGPAAA